MENAASDGAGGQLVGNAGCPNGGTGKAHVGVAHDLPTVALDSASRCPPTLGQPAPARRVTLSAHLRARVAHIPHSPHHDRILNCSEKTACTEPPLPVAALPRFSAKRAKTSIEWTEATWNPVTGCTKVSPGCKHCYAERMAGRLRAMGAPAYRDGFELTLQPQKLDLPLRWRVPQTIFVNSMSDLFHEEVPMPYVQAVFDVMRRASWHRFQVLTKRAERLAALDAELVWAPNIWMGVSVESADYAWRIDCLRRTRAHVRFLSLEPLLGPLDDLDLSGIHWVIVGGESGPGARAMDAAWARSVRDQCLRAGVPFFFKQWGGLSKKRAGRVLDGRTWDEMPGTHCADGGSIPAHRRDVRADLVHRPEERDLAPAGERHEPADGPRVDEAAVDQHGLAEGDALLDLVAGAAGLAGLDEDHRASESGHDAVARGEVPARRGGAGLKRGNHEVITGDLVLKGRVMSRVGLIERRADDRDRAAALPDGGLVRRGVDAGGEARDDHDATSNELARNLGSQGTACVGRATGAHDGDPGAIEQANVAGHVKPANARERHGLRHERGQREGTDVDY
jgi:protein gp37